MWIIEIYSAHVVKFICNAVDLKHMATVKTEMIELYDLSLYVLKMERTYMWEKESRVGLGVIGVSRSSSGTGSWLARDNRSRPDLTRDSLSMMNINI